jgi:hypothetical protein
MDTAKFPHHLDCEALTGLTADHLPRDGSLGRLRRRGLVHYRREGPLRVDVPGLTAYLGRLAHVEAG